MEQNTHEWLELRKNKIGASDAPIIMGVSPWKTLYELWLEKLKLSNDAQETAAMRYGKEKESEARFNFILDTGIEVSPEIIFHEDLYWMMASLDGISSDRKTIVEIKCPGEKDHSIAMNGNIPEKYYPQMQHQLEVCQLDKAFYYSYREGNGQLIEIGRNDKYIKKMLQEEEKFWNCLQNFTAPEMTEKDYHLKTDEVWAAAAEKWSFLHEQLKTIEDEERQLRELLISMSKNQNSFGSGIKVSKILRKGPIDYSKIDHLRNIDLEQYRKEPIECWKIAKSPF